MSAQEARRVLVSPYLREEAQEGLGRCLRRGYLGKGEMRGGPVSRILSTPDRSPGLDDHSSANRVATAVKLPTRASRALASLRAVSRTEILDQPPREAPIWHCSGWGLPCRSCCQSRGGLLPHRFTITPPVREGEPSFAAGQSLLCGAFPGVTPAGRYPAPLPTGVRTFLGACTPRSSSPPREG